MIDGSLYSGSLLSELWFPTLSTLIVELGNHNFLFARRMLAGEVLEVYRGF